MYKLLAILTLSTGLIIAQQGYGNPNQGYGSNQQNQQSRGQMNNPEDFSSAQQRELKEIVQEQEALNVLENCVQNAASMQTLHQCRQTHRQTMDQIKPKPGGRMQGNQMQNGGMNQQGRGMQQGYNGQ